MSFKGKTREEFKKLKHMSLKDRLWYIWAYYKFHMLVLVFAGMLLSVIATSVYRQTLTTRLAVAVINNRSLETENIDFLETRLNEVLNCGKKDILEINNGLYLTPGEDASQLGYATMAKLTALVASKALDVVIADKEVIDYYQESGMFYDLTELLTPEQLALAGDRLTASTAPDGSQTMASLCVQDTWLTDEAHIDMEPTYLAVVISSPRTEAAVQTIMSLIQEP